MTNTTTKGEKPDYYAYIKTGKLVNLPVPRAQGIFN